MTSFLNFYRFLTRLLNPLIPLLLKIRIKLGKEEVDKCYEKIMQYEQDIIAKKALGYKEVVMIHSSSLGESNAVKPLVKELEKEGRLILLTSITKAGVKTFDNYQAKKGAIIQIYLPYDTPQLVEKFLKFWKVNTLLLVESEIWPNLLIEQAKRGKIALVTARLYDKSAKLWGFAKNSLIELLAPLSFIGAASEKDLKNFQKFYPKAILTGNLKCDITEMPINHQDLEELKSTLDKKEVLLAVSTRQGEEEIILEAYKKVGGLLIIAPRNKERGAAIIKLCQDRGFKAKLRYNKEVKSNNLSGLDVFIVNSFGELGTFFSLSKNLFLGGSLVPDIGGHNPCEPALFSCKIIIGPYYKNFVNLMTDMKNEGALIQVANAEELAKAWKEPLGDFGDKAYNFLIKRRGALKKTLDLFGSTTNH
jgi:3-deoxy-D-manno-octulosonic-acid transferase